MDNAVKFILIPWAGLCLWIYFAIVLHEVAHALAGKMVGFSPYLIVIGKGSLLTRLRIGGVDVHLHLSPYGGMTYAYQPPSEGFWWRGAIFSMAGLTSDVLLLCCLFLLANSSFAEQTHAAWWLKTVYYLIVYQGVLILSNLWPHDVLRSGAKVSSDGRQFFRYITRRTKSPRDEYIADVRRHDPGFRIENSWFMEDNRGSIRALADLQKDAASKDYEAVAEKYAAILASKSITNGERAVFLDSLACIALIHGERSFSHRALTWAREAHDLFPGSPTLRGTYGGALVEAGEYVRAVEMLTPLTSEEHQPIDRSISACFLAKAHHHLGNISESEAFLTLGKSLNASCGVCERIEAQLARQDSP